MFEIHDISPVTKEMLEYLVDRLPSNTNPVLMIIPYHKAKHTIDGETIDLFDKFNKKQFAMHGLVHDEMKSPEFENRQMPSFPVLTWPFKAEFKKYSFDEASDAIKFGRKVFDYVGIDTCEFIAPAHSTNSKSMIAIQREFPITADNFGIIKSMSEIRHNIVAMSTSMNGISYKMDNYFSRVCEVYIKGLLEKGEDIRVLHHPAYEKEPNEHTLNTLNLILDYGYKSVTHEEFLEHAQ